MQDYQAHAAYKINGKYCIKISKITKAANVTVYTGRIIAKFHYTDPTGPDRTRADPHGPERPGSPRNSVGPCGSPTKSARVRSGPCSGIQLLIMGLSRLDPQCIGGASVNIKPRSHRRSDATKLSRRVPSRRAACKHLLIKRSKNFYERPHRYTFP